MNHELERLKSQARADSNDVFAVTSGRGRKKKAHILNSKGVPECDRVGKNYRRVDADTVERFYEKCQICSEE